MTTPQQSMDLKEYQEWVKTTRVYPPDVEREYLALQVASEAGEVCGAFSKMLRGDAAINSKHVIKELGDLLWALSLALDMYGKNLKEFANESKPRVKIRTQRSAEITALELNSRAATVGTSMYYDAVGSMSLRSFVGIIDHIKKLADYLGVTLENIAWLNWDKLTDRQLRDVIHDNGHGDQR